MKLKKILFCIPSLQFGGAERVTVYLAEYFHAKGYNITVLTDSEKSEKEYNLSESIPRIYGSSIIKVRNLIKNFSPDLVVIMFAPFAIKIVPAMIGLHIPFVISERNDPNNFSGKKITLKLYQFCMKRSNGLVFQTNDALKYYNYIKKVHKKVIHNPIMTNTFPDIVEGKRNKVICTVGRLHSQKNQRLLIDAFSAIVKKHPDYILEIYGEGELKGELERQINILGISDFVKLMGSTNDVLNQIKNAQIFVLSSDFEGMPNALIEAMSLGLAVVSTDCPCGGPRELIINQENGILIPVCDKESLIKAVNWLIEHENEREIMAKKAKDIQQRLSPNIVMNQWENFFLTVFNKKY